MKHAMQWESYIGLICLALVLSLGAVGIGVAAWRGELAASGVVNTGNIDIVFDNCRVWGSNASTCIASGGKKLIVDVDDAYPGYTAHFRYRVENWGTVPVKFRIEVSRKSPVLDIKGTFPRGVIGANGDGEQADLWLTVNDCDESATYTFEVNLVFSQWNDLD